MPEQSQPGSIWQLGLQPSPATVLPSSHVSPGSKVPFPQVYVHTLGWPAHW
jgi:hypothetical protein